MGRIEEALKVTTDTRVCEIGSGAVGAVASMFGAIFPGVRRAIVIDDVNTRQIAGSRVVALLEAAGCEVTEHVINPDGSWFHATYDKVEEVRDAIAASRGAMPVAVGSGTINDLVKRASDEVGVRYMVVGTAASMDGYTSFGAAITKDGMKQSFACRAPLGCIVDSAIAAAAPREVTASGYADMIAKIPAGADWMLADAVGLEEIHPLAWNLDQGALRETLSNPAGCASGDEREVRKLCEGLVMSAFAMQAKNSSRPASGTEHQIAHYWDMEDLTFEGHPVSHGFMVGIGTLASTKAIEFLLEQDLSRLDVPAAVAAWWPSFDSLAATFPRVFGDRPAHVRRANIEMAKKFAASNLTRELETIKAKWPELSERIRAQIMPFDEVREKLRLVGAPCEPEQIGVSRSRFRETFAGAPFMRNRYFAVDLIMRVGLSSALDERLFGRGGVWDVGI